MTTLDHRLSSLPSELQEPAGYLRKRFPKADVDLIIEVAWLLSRVGGRHNHFLESLRSQCVDWIKGESLCPSILSPKQREWLHRIFCQWESWYKECQTTLDMITGRDDAVAIDQTEPYPEFLS